MPLNTLVYVSKQEKQHRFTVADIREQPEGNETLHLILPQSYLGLVLNLENGFTYTGTKVSSATMERNTFHMVNLPQGEYTVVLPKGLHHTLAVEVPADLFAQFLTDYTFLTDFIAASKRNVFVTLRTRPIPLSPAMNADLRDLWYHGTRNEDLQDYLMDVRAFTLFHHALIACAELMHPLNNLLVAPANSTNIVAAATYLEEHMSENITIETLAEVFNLSKRNLQRGFKRLYRCTVHDYLVQHRMDVAKKLLRDERNSVKSIAIAVGYTNMSHFTKTFTRYYDQNPTAIRSYAAGETDET